MFAESGDNDPMFWNTTDTVLLTAPTDIQSVDHTHGIAHTHSITPDGLYDTGMAQGVHVFIDGVDRTTALAGPWGSGSALDVSDLDISPWITTTGLQKSNCRARRWASSWPRRS